MKSLTIVILAFLFIGCASPRRALVRNDIADAQIAFATLIKYQKTDDLRSLDLFSTNCPVTYTVIEGGRQFTTTLPQDVFREALRKQIALKQGNQDTYEDVKYSQDGTNVLVTAVVHYAASGKRGPFSAVYGRDGDGIFKIREVKVTIFPND